MKYEDKNIEFKSDISKNENDFKAEMVSFLNNNSSGIIYLGADDNGNPIEFDSEASKQRKYKEWEEKLNNWVCDAFEPRVIGLIEIYPNETPFKIVVYPGNEKPYYYKKGDGFNGKGVYIRVGSSKRRASQAEIRRMMNKYSRTSFDSESSGYEDLTFREYSQELHEVNKKFDELSLRLKAGDDQYYNNAGLIISDQNPFSTKVPVFNGITTRTFADKKSFEGSIIYQIKEILKFIDIHNPVSISIGNEPARNEVQSYPRESLREAIVNAFAHRDYSVGADIQIEIFDDRIEIRSPGEIPFGFTVEDIKAGTNSRRNDTLVNALDKINYMENYGSGIRRIYASYSGFNKQPVIKATENSYTIILYNRNYYLNTLSESEDIFKIVEYLRDGKVVSRKEIQEEIGLSKTVTINLLNILKSQNIVLTQGRSVSVKYSLKG